MGMGNSIEGRYPFLDHRIIEFCASLPPSFKLNGLTEKYLLKKLIKNRIPDSIVKRPKQAYRAPVSSTFLGKDAPEYVQEILSSNSFKEAGIFNYDSFNALLKKMQSSERTSEVENMTITAIVSTHLLYRYFILNEYEQLTPEMILDSRIVYDN